MRPKTSPAGRRRARLPIAATLALLAAGLGAVPAPAARADAPETVWLCRPGQAGDPCGGRADAPVDCFYVYPTISAQLTDNADLTPGPEQRFIAQQQAAPFGAACNVWAPVYRQSTLRGLQNSPGPARSAALDIAYDSLESAWQDYLAHHNNGRGVVLIGHSQGSTMLRALIRNRIDGQPAQRQLVAAIVPGSNVLVRRGALTGGDFDSVPGCTEPGQFGCVIAYSAFAETPPPGTRYGVVPTEVGTSGTRGRFVFGPDYEVLCTDPSALTGRSDRTLRSAVAGREVRAYTASCATGDGPHVLMIGGGGPGTGAPAATALPTVPNPTWGLHLWDVNLAQPDLVDIVAAQTRAYLNNEE
ncbi:DUF3089 domain-containing protein [Nocardia sp. NPDC057668]|uniref:DUF3089 domain-containing protein n=1 Tax=Nocardia sp. NPDC057668 TaxID=3346202 RepID=UPI00366E865D